MVMCMCEAGGGGRFVKSDAGSKVRSNPKQLRGVCAD